MGQHKALRADTNAESLSKEEFSTQHKIELSQTRILDQQIDVPSPTVSYTTLFRYVTVHDWLFMSLGVTAAIMAGVMEPLSVLVFGNLSGTFGTFLANETTQEHLTSELQRYSLYFVYIAIGQFVFSYIATTTFIYTGDHIATQFRIRFLSSTLRQNIALFDKLSAGEVTTRITTDTNLIQEGISEKVGVTLIACSSFVAAFVVGFLKSWKLTLILSSTVVSFVLTLGVLSRFIVKYHVGALSRYSKASTIVEECLGAIRTIIAFGAQSRLASQYDGQLARAETWGFKAQASTGLFNAFIMCYVYLTYSLAFWQGSRYLVQGMLDFGSILVVVMSIMLGAFAICNITPNHQSFMSAIAAASKVCALIDRESPMDPFSQNGKQLDHVIGDITFEKVRHIYPHRPDVTVMEDFSLSIAAGKTTALVGASGSGKSTAIGLIERFYDPVSGDIYLDGHDIRDLNLRWLRRQVALVGQEPVLFSTTIFENIRYGLIGTEYEKAEMSRIMPLVESAAILANAHEFITALPQGYETNVGERGFLLSGGQKQRVAIARAIVKSPRILLLDEATSALDTASESIVQSALDKAAEGRTTVVVAHRLSTIQNADKIVVISGGTVVEQGTHTELMAKGDAYYSLVQTQSGAEEKAMREDHEPLNETEGETIMASRDLPRPKGSFDKHPFEANIISSIKPASPTPDVKLESQGSAFGLWRSLQLIIQLNKQEWPYMILGLCGVVITGGANPTSSVLLAKSVSALSLPLDQSGKIRHDINFWSWMYFMLAILAWLGFILHGTAFAYCSEKLIRKARYNALRSILRQDVSFFDRDENSSGALTSFVATETSNLKGLSGATLGMILSGMVTLVASCIVALAIGWKLALVCMSTIPFLIGGNFLRFYILARFQASSRCAYEKSASFACEATSAIRTIASLTREEDVITHYKAQLKAQSHRALRSNLRSSILFALSQALIICSMALGFWYGGTLIARREYDLFRFLICFGSVMFGAQTTGYVFTFADDIGKAKQAATELLLLFDKVPAIDTWSPDGLKLSSTNGEIQFRDVQFSYPIRSNELVLRSLNLKVKAKQTVALVGASGCGKSTIISLMERFYDPDQGVIILDGIDISTLNLKTYRSFISLVSQEPTLFEGTVRENILVGVDMGQVTDKALVQACQDANIYEFILSLPDGFETLVGGKGSTFSGGQKQRIAIARALVRNPKILLLDEATSALDTESEKIVQKALDQASAGRTTFVVAHRLITVRNADVIFVLDAGKVVEVGTHSELLRQGGKYSELVKLQELAVDA